MKPSEIIIEDAQKRGIDPNALTTSISRFVKSGAAIMLQENDSVAVLRNLGNHAVEIHFFTSDSPITMASSIAGIFDKIQDSDINTVYGEADNDQIIQLMRRVGVNTQKSDKKEYNWMWVRG